MCAEAHQTPRDEKTDLQRYLLPNWRNPIVSGSDTTDPYSQGSTPSFFHSPSTGKINPRLDDSVEVWAQYLSDHSGSWPRGVRREANGRPNMLDLKASRLVARLRPEVDRINLPPNGTLPLRHNFVAHVARLFAEPGLYQAYLSQGNPPLQIASEVRYIPFTGVVDENNLDDLVVHLAMCGVTEAMAASELRSWAQEYRRASAAK